MAKNKSNKGNRNRVINNRRARFDYELTDEYTAGIVLYGTEIKSIREGRASLVDSFCVVHNGEVWVKNMHIARYFFGNINNHEERRDRKLLLHKREIRELEQKIIEGYSVIPLRLYINGRGLAKLKIGAGRGKKKYDKRQSIKERDIDRKMQQAMRFEI